MLFFCKVSGSVSVLLVWESCFTMRFGLALRRGCSGQQNVSMLLLPGASSCLEWFVPPEETWQSICTCLNIQDIQSPALVVPMRTDHKLLEHSISSDPSFCHTLRFLSCLQMRDSTEVAVFQKVWKMYKGKGQGSQAMKGWLLLRPSCKFLKYSTGPWHIIFCK